MLVKIKNALFKVLYLFIILYLLIFVPCIWGQKPLVVISGSMEPTLKVGGILYYEKVDLEDLNKNDILVYKYKNHIISHRIVDRVDDGFITKGDANSSIDLNLVNKEQVLGKGTNWSIPVIGYYADFIHSHKYILYISLAVIILDLCSDFYRDRKKKVVLSNEKN